MPEPISRRKFLGRVFGCAALLSVPGAASWLIGRFPPPQTALPFSPEDPSSARDARWWKSACAGVQCTLCPFECFLPEGMRGICNVRMNVGGRLKTLVYARPVSVHVDPIEKKPVFHLYPGSGCFSLATVGCNLKCVFCQNWEISQVVPEQARGEILSPEQIVRSAVDTGCLSIAYTYSEPTVFYEYVYDTAVLAKRSGLYNVMVSAGYINPEPLKALAPYLDIVKIDLKGFNEDFYRRYVKGELRFVLRTLKELKRLNVLTEIVNLVVPTLNDDMEEIRRMCHWIAAEMGPDTPLFFSRFTPQYKMQNLPPTPIETLEEACRIAQSEGLQYVYIGNVPGNPAENTYCPTCHQIVIQRYGYAVLKYNLLKGGLCPQDGTKIPGIWY